jgi:cytochrome c-type biogenesis protein CcmH
LKALRGIAMIAMLVFTANTTAIVFEQRDFDNAEQLERYKILIYELRCLVCQNQNLADSNAELASDLRREVHRMILEGMNNDQIVEFMVARYGDFVLYRPPLKAKTVLLWTGPFVLGIGGVVLLLLQLRRRRTQRAAPIPLSDDERASLDALLEKEKP